MNPKDTGVGSGQDREPKLPTLDDMIRLAHDQAERILVGKLDDQLVPMWLMIDGIGQLFIVGTPWNGEAQKRIVAGAMRAVAAEKGIVAYSMLTEAWMIHRPQPPGQKVFEYDGPPPSEEPDRIEVVVCNAGTKDGQRRLALWRIIRNDNGEVIRLDPEPDEGMEEVFGRFDLFPPRQH